MKFQSYVPVLVALLTICGLGSAHAQDQAQSVEVEEGVFEMENENGEREGIRVMSIASDDGTGMTNSMIVMADSGGMNFNGFGGDSFSLLNSPAIQEELNLVDEQIQQLGAVQDRFRERMSELTSGLRGEGGRIAIEPEMIENLKAMAEEMEEQKRAEIENLLLPGQLERLKQVSLQSRMKNAGTMSALKSREIAEALGLSDGQIEKLKARAEELREEVRIKIEKVRDDARKSLFDELTGEQREKLEQMLGDQFDFSATENDFGLPPGVELPRATIRGR